MRTTLLVLGVLAVALGFAALPAAAIYIETPLTVTAPGGNQVQVGQQVPLVVDAYNETSREAWAGKTVRVEWRLFEDEVTAPPRGVILEALALDAKAHAEFTFTVPQEADDQNINVQLFGNGEHIGNGHLAVGDAGPVIMALGEGPANSGVSEEGPPKDDGAGGTGNVNSARPTPGPGAVVAVAAVAGLALLVARRR